MLRHCGNLKNYWQNMNELEQQFAPKIHAAMDQVIPIPDYSQLEKIEQDFTLIQSKKTGWLIWIGFLLGLSGLATAFWHLSQQKEVRKEEVNLKAPEISRSVENSDRSIQISVEKQDEKQSPVIYQQEVISGD